MRREGLIDSRAEAYRDHQAGCALLTPPPVQSGWGTASSTTTLAALPISPLDAAVDQLYSSGVVHRDTSHLIRWKILAGLGDD
jgi:hypothetical protein